MLYQKHSISIKAFGTALLMFFSKKTTAKYIFFSKLKQHTGREAGVFYLSYNDHEF